MKVKALIEDERRDRDRQRALQEAEEQEVVERQRFMMEEHRRTQEQERERERAKAEQQKLGQSRRVWVLKLVTAKVKVPLCRFKRHRNPLSLRHL